MSTQSNLDIYLGGFAKVLNEQWQVDLRLKAGSSTKGAAISAHKLVLAARSEVFKKMLESDDLKASVGKVETVTLSEMKQEELEAFVEFIYSNRSVLSANEKKHVQSLYLAADKYEIPYLRDLCRNELISSLNSSNALNVLELSFIPFDKALNDSAAKFILRNLKTICNSVEFKLFVGRNSDLSVEIMKAYFVGLFKPMYNSTISMILFALGPCGKVRTDLSLGSFPKGLILIRVGHYLYIRQLLSNLPMWDLD